MRLQWKDGPHGSTGYFPKRHRLYKLVRFGIEAKPVKDLTLGLLGMKLGLHDARNYEDANNLRWYGTAEGYGKALHPITDHGTRKQVKAAIQAYAEKL